jgi:hypothetical protein
MFDLTIRYSDDRLCEIIASRPHTAAPLYRTVARRADLGASLTETMRKHAAYMRSPRGPIRGGNNSKRQYKHTFAEKKSKILAVQDI